MPVAVSLSAHSNKPDHIELAHDGWKFLHEFLNRSAGDPGQVLRAQPPCGSGFKGWFRQSGIANPTGPSVPFEFDVTCSQITDTP